MKKILVIEDNEALRDNIEEILELEGFDVIAARNGEEGVHKAQEFLPDLIVSDVNMPLMDGFEVLAALRDDSSPKTKTIPFIFLTVKKTLQDIRTGMKLGADDYLPKPFNNSELVEAVNKRLKMRHDIVAEETEKYDELKNVVGLPITEVIEEPLKNIERLANLLSGDTAEIILSDVAEIAKLIENDAHKLRKNIIKIIYFYRVEALKKNEEELATLRELKTEEPANQIKLISEELATDFGRNTDLYVHADSSTLLFPEEFLRFCIKELVENAFKYSARNCPVKVMGSVDNGFYNITVQDQGIGFASSSMDQIRPYAKLSKSKYVSEGLGLGLYNIKCLVELFDGFIEMETESGAGTAISILLKTA